MKIIKNTNINETFLFSFQNRLPELILDNKTVCVVISDIPFEEITKTLKKFIFNEDEDTIIYFLNISNSKQVVKKKLLENFFSDIYALPAFLLFKNKILDLKFFGLVK